MRVYFSWINGEFHWPEEDPWRYWYNDSILNELVSIARTLEVSSQTTTVPEATSIATTGSNPMQSRGKRNIVENKEGEQSCKMKAYYIITKEALEVKAKREQQMRRAEQRKREKKRL